jgi:hypothetical protein
MSLVNLIGGAIRFAPLALAGKLRQPLRHCLARDTGKVRPQPRHQGAGNFERIEQHMARMTHKSSFRV